MLREADAHVLTVGSLFGQEAASLAAPGPRLWVRNGSECSTEGDVMDSEWRLPLEEDEPRRSAKAPATPPDHEL